MASVSPTTSDRELVAAVIAGKLTPESAIPLLRGNDPAVKGYILEQLGKQTIQVAQAIGLVNRLDELALSRAKSAGGAGNTLRCKVSTKKGISVYGLQRMPVTLYVEQWERLLAFVDELKGFITAQNGSLSRKRPIVPVAAAPVAA